MRYEGMEPAAGMDRWSLVDGEEEQLINSLTGPDRAVRHWEWDWEWEQGIEWSIVCVCVWDWEHWLIHTQSRVNHDESDMKWLIDDSWLNECEWMVMVMKMITLTRWKWMKMIKLWIVDEVHEQTKLLTFRVFLKWSLAAAIPKRTNNEPSDSKQWTLGWQQGGNTDSTVTSTAHVISAHTISAPILHFPITVVFSSHNAEPYMVLS